MINNVHLLNDWGIIKRGGWGEEELKKVRNTTTLSPVSYYYYYFHSEVLKF